MSTIRSAATVSLAVALSLSAAACKQDKTKSTPSPSTASTKPAYADTLYGRLGGEKAIRAIVDDFADRTINNPTVNFTRKGTPQEWQPTPDNVERFKRGLTAFLVDRTGGPKTYQGPEMARAHAGMRITPQEFAASADDLRASLKKLNVDPKAADELMALVTRTGTNIINK